MNIEIHVIQKYAHQFEEGQSSNARLVRLGFHNTNNESSDDVMTLYVLKCSLKSNLMVLV